MYDVVGISHPLMDISVEVEEEFLEELNLKKGGMQLVDTENFKALQEKIKDFPISIQFGGSVPNTLDGLHLLGCKVAEFGSIGDDEYGKLMKEEKKKKGIGDFLSTTEVPTGTVLALITPDSERTFVVFIGAAAELSGENIDEEIIANAKIVHFTGYEFESQKVRTAVRRAAQAAKENNCLVSFDVADPGVVQRTIIDMKAFIQEHVDILFANEEEAEEFTGKPATEAAEVLADMVTTAVVKLGEKGSIIKHAGSTYNISANKVEAKDTTGAGDMYSAGILSGIVKNLEFDEMGQLANYAAAKIDFDLYGKIASFASSKVVEKIGARVESLDISHIK